MSEFIKRVELLMTESAKRNSFTVGRRSGLQNEFFGAIDYQNSNFIVSALLEKNEEMLWVHSKMYNVSYAILTLAAYIRGEIKPYSLRNITEDISDFLEFEAKILNNELLSAKELHSWEVNAKRG